VLRVRRLGSTTALTSVILAACGGEPTGPEVVRGEAELTIQYVRRLPAIDFVWASANPRTEGWPTPGQPVTWQVSIKNWFPRSKAVTVQWLLDGNSVARTTVTIPGSAVGTADYQWPWTFTRHELTVVVDPDNAIAEEEEANNRLLVYTNALSVGFYVERGLYDYFRQYQFLIPGAYSTSFEDWAQRQITRYNGLFAAAVFPETPNGVVDRLRLDRITIVPDGALPLDRRAFDVGGTFAAKYARPNLADRTVDLQWGFPADDNAAYRRREAVDDNQFYYSGFVQHELGHARTMIDVYGMSVYDGLPGHTVDILEGTTRVAGSAYMPGDQITFNSFPGLKLFSSETGLMASTWTRMDRYSAIMWNRIAGQRARYGNYNEPEDIGDFLNDLPANNRLTLVGVNGVPLAGARVRIYQGTERLMVPNEIVYGRRFDDVPDLELVADAAGEVELGRNPFATGGPIVHGKLTSLFSNAVVIVRVESGGKVGYGFLPVVEFNIQYNTGHTDVGRYRLTITLS